MLQGSRGCKIVITIIIISITIITIITIILIYYYNKGTEPQVMCTWLWQSFAVERLASCPQMVGSSLERHNARSFGKVAGRSKFVVLKTS